jgi:peptide/nickel transport system substrate-binding protein
LRRTAGVAKAAVVLLGAAMIAAACGGDNSGNSSNTTASPGTTSASGGSTTTGAAATTAPAATGGTVTLALTDVFSGYNQGTSSENVVSNQWVTNQVIPSFIYFDDKGAIQVDKNLSDITKTSDNPLTVDVKINPKAVWEDGVPISCDDIYMYWVAQSGTLTKKDDTGKDVSLFSNATTVGFDQVGDVKCSADNKTATLVFSSPFSDWLGLITNQGMVPAHAVAKIAGLTDAKAIRTAYEAKDAATLQKIADAWNTGFKTDQGLKPDIMLSGGPYKITAYVPDQSVTLERNDKYWGTPAALDKIVFRIITDDTAQVQALANSEVQVIKPQPDPDLLNQLKSATNVTSSVNGGFTFEHFDFNFQNPLFQDKAVRQAVAYCIPRDEIVTKLIKPVNDKAAILQNRMFEPFQKDYVDNSGGGYDKADIAKAKSTLEAAGYTLNGAVYEKAGQKVEFKLLHKDNARRSSEQQLIAASCAQAGIQVDDDSDPAWSDRAGKGQFDTAVFAWIGNPLLSSNRSIYKTPADKTNLNQNFGYYSNPQNDALMDTLATSTDPTKLATAANDADKLLWADLATIPLFQFPDLLAFSNKVSNVVYNPTQFDLTWNDNKWAVG